MTDQPKIVMIIDGKEVPLDPLTQAWKAGYDDGSRKVILSLYHDLARRVHYLGNEVDQLTDILVKKKGRMGAAAALGMGKKKRHR
jgi:hypothetical protein